MRVFLSKEEWKVKLESLSKEREDNQTKATAMWSEQKDENMAKHQVKVRRGGTIEKENG
jgi:hypothetical protein